MGEAADGEAALALVRPVRPEIVVTNPMMPRLNGAQLTERIRKELSFGRTEVMAFSLVAPKSAAGVTR